MAESEAETPSTPGEFESKYFEFHGVRLPPFCRGKMEEIANFPVRPSDVWIVTYPKSGEPAPPVRPAVSPGRGAGVAQVGKPRPGGASAAQRSVGMNDVWSGAATHTCFPSRYLPGCVTLGRSLSLSVPESGPAFDECKVPAIFRESRGGGSGG
jgi:hypothetical protein